MLAAFIDPLATLFIVAYFAFPFFRDARRRAGWRALAVKYRLHITAKPRIAPDPEIPGALRRAELLNCMQGEIDGVPVIAFDIRGGLLRLLPSASGIGIQRTGLSLPPMRGFAAMEKDGWTFVYRDRDFRKYRALKASQIEELLTTLLHTAGKAAIPPRAYGQKEPGGIVIRPAKL